MPPQIQVGKQSLTLADPRPLLRVGYGWNRLHYHPRVLRLNFQPLDDLDGHDLELLMGTLLDELNQKTAETEPLLYRTTLPEESLLLDPLKTCGFLETRRVYEPVLTLNDIDANRFEGGPEDVEVETLTDLLSQGREAELLDLFIEVYARSSRLDPATPDELSREELNGVLLGDAELLPEFSSCGLASGRLIGLTTVYETTEKGTCDLGIFGVTGSWLARHQELCLAMLLASCARLTEVGGTRLRAEIDSDDPWTIYACAELPFRQGASSVSLALLPAWGR